MKRLAQFGSCPVATTISLLDSGWKILIMRDLLKGTKRYSQLQKSVSGISQKMLTQSLRQMQDDGIVQRHSYPVIPPKVEYSLTEMGESMRPIINSMHEWGMHYLSDHPRTNTH